MTSSRPTTWSHRQSQCRQSCVQSRVRTRASCGGVAGSTTFAFCTSVCVRCIAAASERGVRTYRYRSRSERRPRRRPKHTTVLASQHVTPTPTQYVSSPCQRSINILSYLLLARILACSLLRAGKACEAAHLLLPLLLDRPAEVSLMRCVL
uniref:Uncharacterized protein n=1 Tax=Trichogramma kaykai TaxID=54128 RepID=A0ABD2WZY1_9HYME